MRKPAPRLPSPYRPDPRPHLTRTAVLLALIGALLVAIAWTTHDLVRPALVIQQEDIVQPYDPGLYTPFTRAPEQER